VAAPGAKPAAVKIGAGVLYIAVLGTTEPTGPSSTQGPMPSAWSPLGYTEDGNDFSQTVTSVDLEVAEELEPVRTVVTSRASQVSFQLAQDTARNLQIALNGGSGTPTVTGGQTTPNIPAIGSEVPVMLAWESSDGLERWIYRSCLQVGAVNIGRKKGVKSLIPVTFKLQRPASGLAPYVPYFDTTLAS
jgi:hypothetical protein